MRRFLFAPLAALFLLTLLPSTALMAVVTDTWTNWGWIAPPNEPPVGTGHLDVVYQNTNQNLDHFEVHQEAALLPVRLVCWTADGGQLLWDRVFQPGTVTNLVPGVDFTGLTKWQVNRIQKTGTTTCSVAYPA